MVFVKKYLFRNKYYGLRNATLSSGDGLTCETAFKTLFVADEYEIMYNYFEIPENFGQSLVFPCDHFKIEPSKYYQNSEIFFDTSKTLRAFEKKLSPAVDKSKKKKRK